MLHFDSQKPKKSDFVTVDEKIAIDQLGMIRATRISLGFAARRMVGVGEIDVHGNVVDEGEQG